MNNAGILFEKKDIKKIREPTEQTQLGVPEQFHGGHGWHKYFFFSKEGDFRIDTLNACLVDKLKKQSVFDRDEAFQVRREEIEGITANPEFYKDRIPDWALEHMNSRITSRLYLAAPDKSIAFAFEYLPGHYVGIEHNVNGRTAYGPASLDCVRFLVTQDKAETAGKVLTVADVFGIK